MEVEQTVSKGLEASIELVGYEGGIGSGLWLTFEQLAGWKWQLKVGYL